MAKYCCFLPRLTFIFSVTLPLRRTLKLESVYNSYGKLIVLGGRDYQCPSRSNHSDSSPIKNSKKLFMFPSQKIGYIILAPFKIAHSSFTFPEYWLLQFITQCEFSEAQYLSFFEDTAPLVVRVASSQYFFEKNSEWRYCPQTKFHATSSSPSYKVCSNFILNSRIFSLWRTPNIFHWQIQIHTSILVCGLFLG